MADDDDDTQSEGTDKYLLFCLADDEYGVPIDLVQSIEELHHIVPVPEMPPYVKGVINLRGTVIPTVDMRLRFGMPERAYDDRTCIIIVQATGRVVGFVVDTVSEVHQIPKTDIQSAPDFTDSSGTDRAVGGIGTVDGEIKILIDMERLVQADEIPASDDLHE